MEFSELIGLLPTASVLCHSYRQRFGRAGLARRYRNRSCYPFYLHRKRLETWQGKYPRSRWV